VAADAEHGLQASEGARDNVKAAGLTVVYDRRYPSATTELAPVVRAIAGTNHQTSFSLIDNETRENVSVAGRGCSNDLPPAVP
jgi:hypothetical protein